MIHIRSKSHPNHLPAGPPGRKQLGSRLSPLTCGFSAGNRGKNTRSANSRRGFEQGGGRCPRNPSGANWAGATRPVERRERARVVASFAEYLAEDVSGHPDRAVEAMAALAEWCEEDRRLLEQARAVVACDAREATLSAQAVIAQNDRDALQLLELVAHTS